MAVDEALLETAIESRVATLRFYQWSEPTVSLGYFQKMDSFLAESALAHLPVVRRLSGGGAILHDDELTYSIALPATQSLFRQPHELYSIVHGAICDVLRSVGFPVTFRGQNVKQQIEPTLCFLRQDEHDVTLNGIKVLGSAQRRRRGAILQHGSLILRASSQAPQLPGLEDLNLTKVPEKLDEILAVRVASEVAVESFPGFLSDFEMERSEKICAQYSSDIPHD